MSDRIVQWYVPEKNPDGAFFPWAGQHDITEDEFNRLAKWKQDSIDASPMYRRTKPENRRTPKPESED